MSGLDEKLLKELTLRVLKQLASVKTAEDDNDEKEMMQREYFEHKTTAGHRQWFFRLPMVSFFALFYYSSPSFEDMKDALAVFGTVGALVLSLLITLLGMGYGDYQAANARFSNTVNGTDYSLYAAFWTGKSLGRHAPAVSDFFLVNVSVATSAVASSVLLSLIIYLHLVFGQKTAHLVIAGGKRGISGLRRRGGPLRLCSRRETHPTSVAGGESLGAPAAGAGRGSTNEGLIGSILSGAEARGVGSGRQAVRFAQNRAPRRAQYSNVTPRPHSVSPAALSRLTPSGTGAPVACAGDTHLTVSRVTICALTGPTLPKRHPSSASPDPNPPPLTATTSPPLTLPLLGCTAETKSAGRGR